MDSLTPEHRSWNMSRIRAKDTAIEIKVGKYLFSQGFRYRKNDKRYPGKPDFVLPKYKAVVFVHGCFWHMHGCSRSRLPKSNLDYWKPKIQNNIERDKRNYDALTKSGWRVFVVWECELKKKTADERLSQLCEIIRN